jgi:hypothetical protein
MLRLVEVGRAIDENSLTADLRLNIVTVWREEAREKEKSYSAKA